MNGNKLMTTHILLPTKSNDSHESWAGSVDSGTKMRYQWKVEQIQDQTWKEGWERGVPELAQLQGFPLGKTKLPAGYVPLIQLGNGLPCSRGTAAVKRWLGGGSEERERSQISPNYSWVNEENTGLNSPTSYPKSWKIFLPLIHSPPWEFPLPKCPILAFE